MRSSVRRPVTAGMLAMAVLAGCGLAGCSSAGPSSASTVAQARPERILAAPRGVLSAAEPSPDGTVWVLAGSPRSRGLFDFDLGTGRDLGSVSVSGAARAVTQSVTGVIGLALDTGEAGTLQLLDGGTGAVTKTVPLGAPAYAVAVGADGTTFYVLTGNGASASVTIVNSATGHVTGTVPVPPDAVSIAPGPQQTTLYVLRPNGTISQIAVAGGKVMGSFPVGESGESLAISPDGNTLYALKKVPGGTNVAVIDLATESVRRVLPAPGSCLQVLVSADGGHLYELTGTAAFGNIQVFPA